MDTSTLHKLFENAKGRKVLVIGDMIIDEYIQGTKAKISPEAPVTAVHGKIKRWKALGGAANVAASVTRLGGEAMLFSLTGDVDDAEHSYPVYNMFQRQPPTKTRIVCNGHHICRLDDEEIYRMSMVDSRRFITELEEVLRDYAPDSVILADYGKSGITPDIFKEISRAIHTYSFEIRKVITLVVDSKTPYRLEQPKHCEVFMELFFTPNRDEWGEYVSRHSKTCSTLVTLGAGGLEYLDHRSDHKARMIRPFSLPTVLDVCGAGDTVTAVCGMMLTGFEDIKERIPKLEAAQLTAETSVQKFGVNPPFLSEVYDYAEQALRKA